MVDLKGKACYQLGLSAHFSGFKLATSMFVLSVLGVYNYSHIPQALHFDYYQTVNLNFITNINIFFILTTFCSLSMDSLVIFRYPDVPCVSQTLSVTFTEAQRKSFIDSISLFGEVSMTGSLQIVELTEQPGGILVQWDDEVQFIDSD